MFYNNYLICLLNICVCYLQFKMSSGFISETEIAEKRKARQEEWEKVRKPDQPLGTLFFYLCNIQAMFFF